MTAEKLERHIVLLVGVFDARVCSEGSYDEALEFLQRTSPAGTENNWQKHDEGTFAPVKCATHPERTHYHGPRPPG